METYHKINALFKRHISGPKKGKLIMDDWAQPEFEYLAKNKWEFTEKIDGTNIRIGFVQNGETPVCFKGRTDNAQIPQPLLEYLTDYFTMERLERDALLTGQTILFGEGVGQKIQDSGKYLDRYDFILFDVKIGDFWLNRENVADIAQKLGVATAPVIGQGTLYDAIDIVSTGFGPGTNGRFKTFSGPGVKFGLKSQFGNFEAEGIVARPSVPLFNRKGERIITKIKAVDFR
jgi:hypothetical protein